LNTDTTDTLHRVHLTPFNPTQLHTSHPSLAVISALHHSLSLSPPLVSKLRLQTTNYKLPARTGTTLLHNNKLNMTAQFEPDKPKVVSCMSVSSLSTSLSRIDCNINVSSNNSSNNSSNVSSAEPFPKRSVSFGPICIREYERTVGDHPAVSVGAALDLTWEYVVHDLVPFEEFEQRRDGVRRTGSRLIIKRREREDILKKDYDVSRASIAQNIRSINRVKGQRRQTVNNLKFSKIEESWQKVQRNAARCIGARRCTKKEIDDLWKNAAKESAKIRRGDRSSICISSSKSQSSTKKVGLRRRLSRLSASIGNSGNSLSSSRKKTTKKRNSLDVNKHVMRYDLGLEGLEGESKTHHCNCSDNEDNAEDVPSAPSKRGEPPLTSRKLSPDSSDANKFRSCPEKDLSFTNSTTSAAASELDYNGAVSRDQERGTKTLVVTRIPRVFSAITAVEDDFFHQ
jgi:hypothetical protein